MYHRILDDNDGSQFALQPGMFVLKQNFQRQLKYLASRKIIIPLVELVDNREDRVGSHDNPVAITFDDGWRDNFTVAFPVLSDLELPATIFLATNFIGSDSIPWFYRLNMALYYLKNNSENPSRLLREAAGRCESFSSDGRAMIDNLIAFDIDQIIELAKGWKPHMIEELIDKLESLPETGKANFSDRLFLDWNEVSEMSRNSISFDSHGCSHRIMTTIDKSEVQEEMLKSKETIEAKTGNEVKFFSYPNGDYDLQIARVAKETGYIGAVTTNRREVSDFEDGRFGMERIAIHDSISKNPRGRFSRAMFAYSLSRLSLYKERYLG